MSLLASRKEALSADDAGRVTSKGSPSKPPKAVDPGRSDLKMRFPRRTDFQNIEEVREAVRDFIEKYNEQWLVEKLGYRSPAQARREYFRQAVAA